jgi:hypothetical protein
VEPVSTTVGVGETFEVSVTVETGTQSVDAVEVHLNFDPAVLQVNNVTDVADSVWPVALIEAAADNSTGEVHAAYGTFSDFPSGAPTFLSIQFETLTTTPNIDLTFGFKFPQETQATFGGQNVLAQCSNRVSHSGRIRDTDGYRQAHRDCTGNRNTERHAFSNADTNVNGRRNRNSNGNAWHRGAHAVSLSDIACTRSRSG